MAHLRWMVIPACLFAITFLASVSPTPAVVYDINALYKAHQLSGSATTPTFGPANEFAVGHGEMPGAFTSFLSSEHIVNFGGNANTEGFASANPQIIPTVLVNNHGTVAGDGFAGLDPGEILMHPGNPGSTSGTTPPFSNAVIRFTVPTTGLYNVTGDFRSLGTGATLNQVLRGSSPQFSSAAADSAFGVQRVLSAGETIDLLVNDGGDGIGGDSTGLRAAIELVPTPIVGSSYQAGADLRVFEIANNGLDVESVNGVWSYGTKDTPTSAFAQYAGTEHHDEFQVTGPAFEGWYDPGELVPAVMVNISGAEASLGCCANDNFAADEIFMHGEQDELSRTFAVVRWTAPGGGEVDISAIWDQKATNAAAIKIVVNGSTAMFDGLATGLASEAESPATFDGQVFVSLGTTIDFLIGPNPSVGYGGTTTGFNATIEYINVPEPASVALIGIALMSALRVRRWGRRAA